MANQNQQLPLSIIIDVAVLPTPAVLGETNITTVAAFVNDQPSGWAGGQTYALYDGAAQVVSRRGARPEAQRESETTVDGGDDLDR